MKAREPALCSKACTALSTYRNWMGTLWKPFFLEHLDFKCSSIASKTASRHTPFVYTDLGATLEARFEDSRACSRVKAGRCNTSSLASFSWRMLLFFLVSGKWCGAVSHSERCADYQHSYMYFRLFPLPVFTSFSKVKQNKQTKKPQHAVVDPPPPPTSYC